MAASKHGIQWPNWAPADLVLHAEQLRPRVEEEKKRIKAAKLRIIDKKAELENRQLHIGMYFVGSTTEYRIAQALMTAAGMAAVWKNLQRRVSSFKPVRSLHGGMAQACNLQGACVEIENRWINLPKLTRAESRKLHMNIAATSLQLTEQLLQVEARDLLDIRKFIDEEREKDFVKGLEKDGRELWYGFEGYLDYLLGEMLEPIPALLLKLHKRALEYANHPLVVSQPNSRNAKANYFIQELSKYFTKSYGRPLHAHVAAVVSAILQTDVSEDRVRALLRARKVAAKRFARKKLAQLRKEIDG
jgi:hypothetical protein